MSVTPRFTSSSMCTPRNSFLSNGMLSIAELSAPTATISWSSMNFTASKPRPACSKPAVPVA
ncbi:MAG: hypothetical protein U0W40_11360 [Acidimicrobiia bacterium]